MRKIIIAATSLLLFSCSSNEGIEQDNIPPEGSTELTFYEKVSLLNSYELSEDHVLNMVKMFNDKYLYYDEIQGEKESPTLKIKEKMDVPEDLSIQSRGIKAITIPIFKVQLDCGNKHGYALVSGDIRNPKVLTYIPDTVVTDKYYDTNAAKAAEMMKNMAIMANIQRIKDFDKKKEALRKSATEKLNNTKTRSFLKHSFEITDILNDAQQGVKIEQSEKTLPLMKTAWNQGEPYNCKLPQDCENTPDGRYYTGCGVVAVAQAMAYYEPELTLYGTAVNWKNLKKSSVISVYDDKEIKDQIGYLMKWIGEKGNARYTYDRTYTGDIISDVLSIVGMKCDRKTAWNLENIKGSINNNNLVHATATNAEGEEYAWILDGYITALYPDNKDTDMYIHSNFGWSGCCDGYYELEPMVSFKTDGSSFTPSNINTNISKK